MLDWKPGDKLVAINTPKRTEDNKDCPLEDLVIGRQYTLAVIWDEPAAGPCLVCSSTLMLHIEESNHPEWAYCPCCFRKPLDLPSYFNLQAIKKVHFNVEPA